MLRIALLFGLLALAPAPAHADDCRGTSAHLVGDAADTLGVTVTFSPKTGWTMAVRPKPGAPVIESTLPLPTEHAHYLAYVLPGRAAIAIVESSAGVTKARPQPVAGDRIAWLFASDGKLVRTWTYGDVLTKPELANLRRSISHVSWSEGGTHAKPGLTFPVGKRTVVFDAKARALR